MFKEGDLVFARVKGYRPWPAKVTAVDGNDVSVIFYGTYQVGHVKEQSVWMFDEKSKAKFKNATKSGQAKFNLALREIENDPEVVDNLDDDDDVDRTPRKKMKMDIEEEKEHRKMWIQVKDTEDIIEIDLDKNRPAKFASKAEALKWEEKTAKDALKFKRLVEAGKYVPEEVVQRLEQKSVKTQAELNILEKWSILNHDRAQKIEWLKVESKIIQIEMSLKKSLHPDQPQYDKCLELLKELKSLQITPLMLKKQPQVIKTLYKMRHYVGPVSASTDSRAIQIRSASIGVLCQLEALFGDTQQQNFLQYFEALLEDFQRSTQGLSSEQITYMTTDPTRT